MEYLTEFELYFSIKIYALKILTCFTTKETP